MPPSSSTCAPKLLTTPSSLLSRESSSLSGGFLAFLGALPGPGKMHSIPCFVQFEHGFFLSQRTFLRRHVTQLRGFSCMVEPVRLCPRGLVGSSLLPVGDLGVLVSSEAAGVNSGMLSDELRSHSKFNHCAQYHCAKGVWGPLRHPKVQVPLVH